MYQEEINIKTALEESFSDAFTFLLLRILIEFRHKLKFFIRYHVSPLTSGHNRRPLAYLLLSGACHTPECTENPIWALVRDTQREGGGEPQNLLKEQPLSLPSALHRISKFIRANVFPSPPLKFSVLMKSRQSARVCGWLTCVTD